MRGLFRQLIEQQAVNPYISGHVTDGSSTFTFTVNDNESITVPVDANGDWKWVVDRTITSLSEAFRNKTNVKRVDFACNLDMLENLYYSFHSCTYLQEVRFKEGLKLNNVTNADHTFGKSGIRKVNLQFATFEKVTTVNRFFDTCRDIEEIDLSNATFNSTTTFPAFSYGCPKLTTVKMGKALFNNGTDNNIAFLNCPKLENIELGTLKSNLNFASSNLLTEQSVVNLINAAAKNVTYTLHSTVYNKCASGGEWYTDIQAAIDAKALEGYTVTLISA